MRTYLDQLKAHARMHGMTLHKAFKLSKVDMSTYSRTIRSRTDIRFSTAKKVWEAVAAAGKQLPDTVVVLGKRGKR